MGFANYAHDSAAHRNILVTCLPFDSAIDEVQHELRTHSFPELKLNEAMVTEASKLGQSRKGTVAMFSIFSPTLPSIPHELQDIAEGNLNLQTHYIDGALEALTAGEEEKCCSIIAEKTAKVV